jgi:hypothetical protein
MFSRPYWLDQRSDVPEQYVAEEVRSYEENS